MQYALFSCVDGQKNSLGRSAPEEFLSKGKTGAWNCIPGAMHGVGKFCCKMVNFNKCFFLLFVLSI